MTDRQLATVLAALRRWQRTEQQAAKEGLRPGGAEHDVASDCGTLEPLNSQEIDDLCEYLNAVESGQICGECETLIELCKCSQR